MTTPNDAGPNPFVVDVERSTLDNMTYRTTLWTGTNLQMTVMAIEVGHDIGLEVHPDRDQFLRVEGGRGRVQMGPAEDDLSSSGRSRTAGRSSCRRGPGTTSPASGRAR